MDNLEIVIKLDPVNDGFKKMPDFGKLKDKAAIIIGTNGKSRTIGDTEVIDILDRMDGHSEGFPIDDMYIATVDDRKIMKIGSARFVVGSFMVMKCAGGGVVGASLLDADIEDIMHAVESRMVTLSTGTEEFSAYQLEW